MVKVDAEGKMYLICHHCKKEFNSPDFDSANPYETLPKDWIALYFQERGIEFYCNKKDCINRARSQLGKPALL